MMTPLQTFEALAPSLVKAAAPHSMGQTPGGHPMFTSAHPSYAAARGHIEGTHSGVDALMSAASAVRDAHPHYGARDHLHASEAHANHAATLGASHRGPAHFISQAHAHAAMGMYHEGSHKAQRPKRALSKAPGKAVTAPAPVRATLAEQVIACAQSQTAWTKPAILSGGGTQLSKPGPAYGR